MRSAAARSTHRLAGVTPLRRNELSPSTEGHLFETRADNRPMRQLLAASCAGVLVSIFACLPGRRGWAAGSFDALRRQFDRRSPAGDRREVRRSARVGASRATRFRDSRKSATLSTRSPPATTPVGDATDCALSFKRSLPGDWRLVMTEAAPECSSHSPFPRAVLVAWKVCAAPATTRYYVWGNRSLGSPAHGTFDVSGTNSWYVSADAGRAGAQSRDRPRPLLDERLQARLRLGKVRARLRRGLSFEAQALRSRICLHVRPGVGGNGSPPVLPEEYG